MTVVGNAGPWSLANAFVKPVCDSGEGLVVGAIRALDSYWKTLEDMYGKQGRQVWVATLDQEALTNLTECNQVSLREVFEHTTKAAFTG